jgi:hypothetical protein
LVGENSELSGTAEIARGSGQLRVREQDQRRRRLAELLDAERDAIGLDRHHEAGAGAMVPSGVRNGRTVGCIVVPRFENTWPS